MGEIENWVCEGCGRDRFCFTRFGGDVEVSLGLREMLEPGEIFLSVKALTLVWPPW